MFFIGGCGGKADLQPNVPPSQANDNNEEIRVKTSAIKVSAQTENGQKLWELSAEKALASMDPKASFGNLENVEVEMFDNDEAYVRITADKGNAEQKARRFSLAGNVFLQSDKNQARIQCDKIEGAPEPGLVTAIGNVKATVNQISIGPARKATAKFKSIEKSMNATTILTSLILQGDDIWFTDSSRNLVISGVLTGKSKFSDDGKTVIFDITGSPAKLQLKDKGVVFIGKKIVASMMNSNNTYDLKNVNVSGNINASFEGIEKGEKYLFGMVASGLNFDADTGILNVNGGVVVNSEHPSMFGKLTTPNLIVNFEKQKSGNLTRFRPATAKASGKSTFLEETNLKLTIKNIDQLTFGGLQNSDRNGKQTIDCTGSPMRIEYSPKTGQSVQNSIINVNYFEGVIGKTDSGSQEILSAKFGGNVNATIYGESSFGNESAKPWSLNMICETATYSRLDSILKLQTVDRITGKHPALPTGEGTLFAPYIDIVFRKNTFEPISIRTAKVGGKR